jgi:YHS domain-containing protein
MKRISLVTLFLTVLTIVSSAQATKKIKALNVDSDNLALDGYDPVAYFKGKKAVEGERSITAVHEGVKYQFSSEANKNLFVAAPANYLPQYGGWCAYAMGAKGEKVEVDPETFKIVDGKLYLFYNKFFNNTLETWNKNEGTLKVNADKNWSKIITP